MNIIKKYAVWIVIALTFIACIYVFFKLLLPLDVFLWDESHHGFYAMQIYNDLRAGDWEIFWVHTNNQALWMPLHSWLAGIFLYVFGFSYAAARASSLFLFFWCSILIFLIGLEMSKEKGWLIGLIAVCLYLTSPILLSMATLNMQEMLGIFVLLSLFYFMVRYQAVEAFWKYLVVGLLISIAYWAKSNYATQLILGVGLFQLSLLWKLKAPLPPPPEPTKGKKHLKKPPKPNPQKNIYYIWFISDLLIIAGFLPLFILWWVTPPFERKYALGFIFRTQGIGAALFYPSVNFFGRGIFYLQSLVSSYTFSLWLGLGLLTALVGACYWFEDKKIRLALILFLGNLFMISMVGNIQERYISTAAPLVFILLAYFVVFYGDKLRDLKAKTAGSFLLVFIAAAVFYDALSFHRYTREVANRSILFPIYKESLNHFNPPFIFGLIKRPAFTYPMDQTKKYLNFKVTPKSSINDVLAFYSSNIERNKSISTMISFAQLSPYVIYWHFQGWQAPVFSVNDLGINPKYFWNSEYFIGLQASSESPYNVDWLEKRWNEISPILLKSGHIKLVASKEYADLGLTANIYKREKEIIF